MSHLARLDAFAATWRLSPTGARRFVPGFDPDSGGDRSRVLVLMQSPGPSTIARGDAAISSEDNPGPTAVAFRRARMESGLDRFDYLRWNIVPWALDHTPRIEDLEDARPALAQLMSALPDLRAVVTFGTPALMGIMRYFTLDPDARVVPVLAAPHPSPANATRAEEKHRRSVTALHRASQL
ncbi:uracil-DNA glycosylase [Allobranchiibius sp. GilTou73]|uniref:uracil-DNA glycosylase n=1 Tax=Allobranchiibius sp. GilTou73 TaxID=2904523 RepID=UPI002103F361|nr:uracil-DNA glycosylase [Allobranchiibius sp. GilTou73]